MATLAEITNYKIQDDEAVDSYSLVPLFTEQKIEGTFREATIFHSVNGSFAIRKGDWKLIMCGGSGGWSYPTQKSSKQSRTIRKSSFSTLKKILLNRQIYKQNILK
jgi:arylsulfatase A